MTYNEDKKRYEFVFDIGGKEEAFYVSDTLLKNSTDDEMMSHFDVRIKYIIDDFLTRKDASERVKVHMALHGTNYKENK